jgi:hypothetical protein
MTDEVFVPIKGYEGLYEISNYGNVKSLKFNKERIMRNRKVTGGYLEVELYRDSVSKACRVHRLVGDAFLEKFEGKIVINHKDGNKENNHVSNLEWCTYSHNNQHAYDTKLNDRVIPVNQYALNGMFIRKWDSIQQASNELSIQKSGISKCTKGQQKTCGGYLWKI